MGGFGSYHYVYDSGREGDVTAAGFSPRKAATVVYLMDGFEERTRARGARRRGPDGAAGTDVTNRPRCVSRHRTVPRLT
jgi:hypothetical protein